jgi:hypothetical protein
MLSLRSYLSLQLSQQKKAAKPDLMVIDEPEHEPTYEWMNPIKMLLENQLPSNDNAKVKRIMCKSKMYHLIDGILITRHQRHDDEVYLQRRRHPIALGYSQWCMRIILIMALYHRQSLQA